MPPSAGSHGLAFVAFTAWTAFSFIAHYCARAALSKTWPASHDRPYLPLVWYAICALTFVQCFIGAVILYIAHFLLRMISTSQAHDGKSCQDYSEHRTSIWTISLTHAFATLATNAGIGWAGALATFTIKAFEPITTLFLVNVLAGSKIETSHLISLPLVVTGGVGFVYRPETSVASGVGIMNSLMSNLFFGVRNMNLKMHTSDNLVVDKLLTLSRMSFEASAILGALLLFETFLNTQHFYNLYYDDFFSYAVYSSFFHVTYTILSTVIVLQALSVVGHATANLMKRVIVAAVFFILRANVMTPVNLVSLFVFLLGLTIYAFPRIVRFDANESAQRKSLVLSAVLFVLFLGSSLAYSHWSNFIDVPVYGKQLIESHSFNVRNIKVNEMTHGFKSHLNNEDIEFLNYDLVQKPEMADLLSKKLKHPEDVVKEAGRIHDQIFGHLLNGYRKAILVNIFTWFNKGDQLITIGERVLMQKYNLTMVYYCFYPGDDCNFTSIPKERDMVVFIQGAGYIGHPSHVGVVAKTINAFPSQRIVVFPISVCYPTPGCDDIASFQRVFSSHRDVNIILRDRISYEKGVKFFNRSKNFLAPDSAFAVGFLNVNMIPSYDIIWVKRNDWENYGDDFHDQIPPIPNTVSYIIQDWDETWMDGIGKDFWETHQLKAWSGLLYLARAKVVITDRLHAHLMSTLMGKPNVVQNSRTRKQQNYYDTWEAGIENCFIVDTAKEALEKALLLLKKYY